MITRTQWLNKYREQLEDAFTESDHDSFDKFVEGCWQSYDESQVDNYLE